MVVVKLRRESGDAIDILDPRGFERAAVRALRKASSTALRDMRSEASKRVRKRKRLKARRVRKALHLRRPRARSFDRLNLGIDVSGEPVRVSDYPHRQIRKGVSVAVNRGKRTVIQSAFVATMKSGHRGVFLRRGARRLPIHEPLASRPVDALLHRGEAEGVADRGAESLSSAFDRLLSVELAKGKG